MPLFLASWIFDNYLRAGQTVLDTHLGSGSVAIAANQQGIRFVGIELDESMFHAACERIERAQAQGKLFEPAPMKQTQDELI